jgi:N-glycosidase YbiA
MAIDRFVEDHHFLSESFLLLGAPMNYDGRLWITVRHLFNALRTDNKIMRDAIRQSNSLEEVDKLGRSVEPRPNWGGIMLDVRRMCHKLKFSSPKMRARLLATGDESLINGNTTGDRYWGVCDGRGENHDGKILMRLRECLRQGVDPWPVFNRCSVCEHARRTGAINHVGCAHWNGKAQKYADACRRTGKQPSEEELYKESIHPMVLEVMATGWVYLKQCPEHKDSPSDTGDQHIMTRDQIVVPAAFRCNDYQARLNF